MNRKDRQAATRQMTKCACGNVAAFGTNQCGRCLERDGRLTYSSITCGFLLLHNGDVVTSDGEPRGMIDAETYQAEFGHAVRYRKPETYEERAALNGPSVWWEPK